MKYKEFLEYLEKNLSGYQIFMRKARQYQIALNANRQKKSRWSEEKIEKGTYEMWKKSMQNLYNTLQKEIDSDSPYSWTSFIEKNSILENVNEGIQDLDFSSEGA